MAKAPPFTKKDVPKGKDDKDDKGGKNLPPWLKGKGKGKKPKEGKK